ncbi:hypothetical protein [Desulfomonile tiedjei]|uniref:hypothetical protein n=1 Tax=Desulfomonile tiedjei TaxID=2358 RepID=UPI0003003073|nr:hypothetical protein [Desulfomonile tiedjei]
MYKSIVQVRIMEIISTREKQYSPPMNVDMRFDNVIMHLVGSKQLSKKKRILPNRIWLYVLRSGERLLMRMDYVGQYSGIE